MILGLQIERRDRRRDSKLETQPKMPTSELQLQAMGQIASRIWQLRRSCRLRSRSGRNLTRSDPQDPNGHRSLSPGMIELERQEGGLLKLMVSRVLEVR